MISFVLPLVLVIGLLLVALFVGKPQRHGWVIVAALVVGGGILVLAGGVWLERAAGIHPEDSWPWLLLPWLLISGLVGRHRFRRVRTAGQSSIGTESKPTAPSTPARPLKLFLSYRRIDSQDVSGRIHDRLAQHFGPEYVFKDVDSIPLGVDFRKYVGEQVGRCHVLLAVIGPNWLLARSETGRRLDDAQDLVRIEIASALKRDIPVVPVLIGGATIPPEEALPQELRELSHRNGIPVRPDPDFHKDVTRLIEGIETHRA